MSSLRVRPLIGPQDLADIVEAAAGARFIGIGDASHGTEEFYSWRAELTKRLVTEQSIQWIGVEGDWPDCWRLDRWVRGIEQPKTDAREMLLEFERWPTWLWANDCVADFLDWLRDTNSKRAPDDRVGFYGLDVYSLWDSMRRVSAWLAEHSPSDAPAAVEAWRCFLPSYEDPERYAWRTKVVPHNCEPEVVELLTRVRAAALKDGWEAFDATQNAEIAAAAEHYYRVMLRGDRQSWNIRDTHMTDTVDRIAAKLGPSSRGVIWAHNTHIGDGRATDMAAAGMVNIGQLLRERYGREHVMLIGTAADRGSVLAAPAWGSRERTYLMPAARQHSHEAYLHRRFGYDVALTFGALPDAPLRARRVQRAIGVVYDPAWEAGNYVPTELAARYDALLWFEHATALTPLRREPTPSEPEFETEPSGY